MSERYTMGWDQGGPGGDDTVHIVFDRWAREIVRYQRIRNAVTSAEIDAFVEKHFGPSRNPSGVDDQGEAQVVDPPALPAPGAPTKAGE